MKEIKIISGTRKQGSRCSLTDRTKRGVAKTIARTYLLQKNGTDNNFGGDIVYGAIDGLNEKFLVDPELAAGLGIVIGKMRLAAQTLEMATLPKDWDAVEDGDKYLNEREREFVLEVVNFYGKEKKDYKERLEEMIYKLKVKAKDV